MNKESEQSEKLERAEELARYLKERSVEICRLNGCTPEAHKCESYAYIRHDFRLLDVCGSDYFQGCSQPHAAISLPFDGTAEDLIEALAWNSETEDLPLGAI